MQINKVHCLFEQSGVFKQAFLNLGIPAEDYDIQNNFGETDHQIDLFAEIEKGYEGKESIFDNIGKEDLIMAFFPCVYFEAMQANYYTTKTNNLCKKSGKEKFDIVINRIEQRNKFYILLYKLIAIMEIRGLRMILENPATQPHYLFFPQNFIKQPDLIDKDRTMRGDFFKKPTGYWFFNCKPTKGESFNKSTIIKKVCSCKRSIGGGICSEERSMISPEYAKNFIADFILGKPNENTLMTLF